MEKRHHSRLSKAHQKSYAPIAGAYLAGTSTRRVRRALAALFGGAVGKDTDGTVVRMRLDKKATSISLLVAPGVRADSQKVLLAVKNMREESEAAWRSLSMTLSNAGCKRRNS
jgi:transposase-like protein